MSKTRTAILLAATAGLLATTPALSAPKRYCEIVKDAEGDATGQADSVDIVAGDLASNAKQLTAVIRVKKVVASEPTAPLGLYYSMRFTVPGRERPYFVSATRDLQGDYFQFGEVNGNLNSGLGEGTGVFDTVKNEIRIHVPAAMDGSTPLKPGTKINDVRAFVQRQIGTRTAAALSGADSTPADALGAYVAGAPSCTAVGK